MANLKKNKAGISPVIAVIILVSIAIVLVVSFAGFASSIVGVYSTTPQISVKSMDVDKTGYGKIVFYNAGASSDSVLSVQVSPNSPVYFGDGSGNEGSARGAGTGGGSNGSSGSNNGTNHSPECSDHSENGNCNHDQDRGQSGNVHGNNQHNQGGNNTGGSAAGNNTGGQSTDSNNYDEISGMLIPPNSESEIFWDNGTSVGEFYSGQMITVKITLSSGNSLTYTTVIP